MKLMPANKARYLNQPADKAAPHIGRRVKSVLKAEGLTRADIARGTARSLSTVHVQLERSSMQTAILWEICHVLKYNFFADLAAALPEDYRRGEGQDKLVAENAALQAKLELMRELLAGK